VQRRGCGVKCREALVESLLEKEVRTLTSMIHMLCYFEFRVDCRLRRMQPWVLKATVIDLDLEQS
jgi:hypothetical protein